MRERVLRQLSKNPSLTSQQWATRSPIEVNAGSSEASCRQWTVVRPTQQEARGEDHLANCRPSIYPVPLLDRLGLSTIRISLLLAVVCCPVWQLRGSFSTGKIGNCQRIAPLPPILWLTTTVEFWWGRLPLNYCCEAVDSALEALLRWTASDSLFSSSAPWLSWSEKSSKCFQRERWC